ncbi:hypothetical protein V1478_000708 [Vespula squamosa]|uniref:Uncharacterized protein n=1 Tax=Vespula squamosa TaxID=30214 RepID=A0ABD2C696_VESSQ
MCKYIEKTRFLLVHGRARALLHSEEKRGRMKEREKERAAMFDSAAPASDAAATLLVSSTSQFGSQPCTVKKGTSFNFYIFETSFARRGKKIDHSPERSKNHRS